MRTTTLLAAAVVSSLAFVAPSAIAEPPGPPKPIPIPYPNVAASHPIALAVPPELLAKHPQTENATYHVKLTFKPAHGNAIASTCDVLGIAFAAHATRDVATGQASGKRQWKPVTLMMPTQTCVPRLSQAVSKNEQLAVTIDFTPTDPSKSPHKLVLTNAMVTSLKAQPAPSSHETMAVSISFEKITWTHTEGGKTASDDWSQ